MPFTTLIAPALKHYLSIDGIKAGDTYRYKTREDFDDNGQRIPKPYPTVRYRLHRPKHQVAPIIYMAVKAGADVHNLQRGEKLYVGSQITADRMFRGDVLPRGTNFHHGDMRSGNKGASLGNYLEAGGQVDIYLSEADELCGLTSRKPELANLHRLLSRQTPFEIKKRHHTGYLLEQLILREEYVQWAWNLKKAERPALEILEMANI